MRQREEARPACPHLCLIFHAQGDLARKRGVPAKNHRETDQISTQAPHAGVALGGSDRIALFSQPISELARAEIVMGG